MRASDDLARAGLKTATKLLLRGLGGQEACSAATRVAPSKLNEYGNANCPDRFMPADVVLDLELCGNDPLITRELARLQGFTLLPIELGEGDVALALAEVAKDCGKTLSDALTALAGGLTPAETDVLTSDLCQLSRAVTAALGVMRARMSAGPFKPAG